MIERVIAGPFAGASCGCRVASVAPVPFAVKCGCAGAPECFVCAGMSCVRGDISPRHPGDVVGVCYPRTSPPPLHRLLQLLGTGGPLPKTVISDVFGGHLCSVVVCDECRDASVTVRPPVPPFANRQRPHSPARVLTRVLVLMSGRLCAQASECMYFL